MSATAKLVTNIAHESSAATSTERNANWHTQPPGSRAIRTPSFNERSECPEEGSTRKRRGRILVVVSTTAKLVKNIGGNWHRCFVVTPGSERPG